MRIFDRNLPTEEALAGVLIKDEVGDIESTAAASDDAVWLACIEDHGGSTAQRDAKIDRGKMHIPSRVFAEEEIAKCGMTVLLTIMVVARAQAGHERDVAGSEYAW